MITRSFKAATLALVLCTAIVVVDAGRASAQEAAPVTVTFSGITRPTGALYFGVYDSDAAFTGGEPVAGGRLDVTGSQAAQAIAGLKPGTYAIKAYHDVDGDGRMNTNAFGVPTEPYAASNNAPATMGPPAWADARFEVTAEGASQDISID